MPGESILIIDDDDDFRKNLALSLEMENMKVFQLDKGNEVLSFIENNNVDIVILDLVLTDIDGFDLLKNLRLKHNLLPIIILSAKNTESSIVSGLRLGADDYMTKPFRSEELIARINTNLRRAKQLINNDFENRFIYFDSMKLDTGNLILYIDGNKIKLNSRLFKLMKYFMENPDRVLTKSQIYDHVWGDNYFVENTVTIYIRKLRKIIEKEPDNPVYLQTVWGMGYKFSIVE
jgi:DNA-binding response OmpR family regulator